MNELPAKEALIDRKELPEEVFDRGVKEFTSLAEKLPDPGPELRHCVVVPLHQELSNNYFWSIMTSFALQADSLKRSEFLFVVNNYQEIALHCSSLTEAASDSKCKAFQENQDVLFILRKIQEAVTGVITAEDALGEVKERLSNSLTQRELHIVALAIRRKTRCYGIDLSSPTTAFPEGRYENPRGSAKRVGTYIAYDRLKRAGNLSHSVIDFLDADCFVPRNYGFVMASVAEAASEKNGSFVKPVRLELTSPPDLTRTKSPISRLAKILYFYGSYKSASFHLYYQQLELEVKPENYSVSYDTSAIAFRPIELRRIGGYHATSANEDFTTSNAVLRNGSEIYPVDFTEVKKFDRSATGSVDGLMRTPPEFPDNWKAALDNCRARLNFLSAGFVRALLEADRKAAEEYKTLYLIRRRTFYKKHCQERLKFINTVEDVLSKLVTIYLAPQSGKHDVDVDLITEEVSSKINLSSSTSEFLMSNLEILKASILIMQHVWSELPEDQQNNSLILYSKVWSELLRLLPEYFQPPSLQEPSYDLLAVSELAEKNSNNMPEDFKIGPASQYAFVNPSDYLHIVDARYGAKAGDYHATKMLEDLLETYRGKDDSES